MRQLCLVSLTKLVSRDRHLVPTILGHLIGNVSNHTSAFGFNNHMNINTEKYLIEKKSTHIVHNPDPHFRFCSKMNSLNP